jgi:hypothetical protein
MIAPMLPVLHSLGMFIFNLFKTCSIRAAEQRDERAPGAPSQR